MCRNFLLLVLLLPIVGSATVLPDEKTDSENSEVVNEYFRLSARASDTDFEEQHLEFEAKHDVFVHVHRNQRVLWDYREIAFDLLIDAATNGHVGAQHNIAVLYLNGDWVERDDDQALNWFLIAAQQGLPDSQVSLGSLYYSFAIEQKDAIKQERLLSESSRWLNAAIENGNLDATDQVHAKGQLAVTSIYATPTGAKAWSLLIEASCLGSELAIEHLDDYSLLIVETAEAGDKEAQTIVKLLEESDFGNCGLE